MQNVHTVLAYKTLGGTSSLREMVRCGCRERARATAESLRDRHDGVIAFSRDENAETVELGPWLIFFRAGILPGAAEFAATATAPIELEMAARLPQC